MEAAVSFLDRAATGWIGFCSMTAGSIVSTGQVRELAVSGIPAPVHW